MILFPLYSSKFIKKNAFTLFSRSAVVALGAEICPITLCFEKTSRGMQGQQQTRYWQMCL